MSSESASGRAVPRSTDGVPTEDLLASVRDLAEDGRPPTYDETEQDGEYPPEAIARRVDAAGWPDVLREAGFRTRWQYAFAAAARAARDDRTWMTPREMAERWAPEWVMAQDVSLVLGQLDESEHGLTAGAWNPDSKRGTWRVRTAESRGESA